MENTQEETAPITETPVVIEDLTVEEAQEQESRLKLILDQATASKLAPEIQEAANNLGKAVEVTAKALEREESGEPIPDKTIEEEVVKDAEDAVKADVKEDDAALESVDPPEDKIHKSPNGRNGKQGTNDYYYAALHGKDVSEIDGYTLPTREEAWKRNKKDWEAASGNNARESFDRSYNVALRDYNKKTEAWQHVKNLAQVDRRARNEFLVNRLDPTVYHVQDDYATADFYTEQAWSDRTTAMGDKESIAMIDDRRTSLATGYILNAEGNYVYKSGAHGDIIGQTLDESSKKVIALVYNTGEGHVRGDKSVSAIYEGETDKIQGRGIVNKSDYNYVKNEGSWFTKSNDMGIESHWYDAGGRFINDTAIGFAEFGVGAAQGISGIFGGSDTMDDLMTMLQGAKLGQSKESMENQFTADNIIFMLSDLIMQLGTGKVVGNLAFGIGKKLATGAMLTSKGKKADKFRRVAASATQGFKGEKLVSDISKYTSSGYMTLNATKGSYAQAKAAGYSNEEAGAYWLASSVALFGVGRILNYTDNFLSGSKGLGVIPNLIDENTVKYATRESVIAGLKATGAKQGLKDKALKAFIKKGVKKSVSDGSIASAKSQIGKIRGWFNDHDAGIMGYVKAGASEGLEEVIEGMAQDVINLGMNEISDKGHIRTYGDVGYLQEKGEQIFLEFGLGAIGGTFAKLAFGKGPGAFEGNSIEEAVMMGMGSKVMQETLDKYNRGSLGSKTLTYEKDAEGNYLPASKPEESQANMNLNIIRTQINHATMMIEDTGGMAAINAVEGRAAEVKGKIERAAIVEDIKEDIKEASVLINDNDLAGKVEETFYTNETDPEMSIADKNVIVDKTVALINENRADEDKVSRETIRKVLEAKTRIKKFANDDDTVLKYFFRSGDISHGMTEEQKKKYGRDFVFNQYNATIKAQEDRKSEFDDHKLLVSTYSQAVADYKVSKDPTKILELFKSKPPKYLDKETREELLSIMSEYSGTNEEVKGAQDYIHLMKSSDIAIRNADINILGIKINLEAHADDVIKSTQEIIDTYETGGTNKSVLNTELRSVNTKIASLGKIGPRFKTFKQKQAEIAALKQKASIEKSIAALPISVITADEYNLAVTENTKYREFKTNINDDIYSEGFHNLIHKATYNARLNSVKDEDSMSDLYSKLETEGILVPRSPYLRDEEAGFEWIINNILDNVESTDLASIGSFLMTDVGSKILIESTKDVETVTPMVSVDGEGLDPFKEGSFFKNYQERLKLIGSIMGASAIEDFKVNDFRLLLKGFTVAEDGSIVQGTSLEGSVQTLYDEAIGKSPNGNLGTSLFTNEAGTIALLEAIIARLDEARAISGSDSAIELNTTQAPGKYRELRVLPNFINKRRKKRRAVKRSKVKRTSETFAVNDTMMAIASQAARVSKDNARKEKTEESYSDITAYELTREFVNDFIPNLPHTVADKARMREIEIEAKDGLTPVEREELHRLISHQAKEAARRGKEPKYGVMSPDQEYRRDVLEDKKNPKYITHARATKIVNDSPISEASKKAARTVINELGNEISLKDVNQVAGDVNSIIYEDLVKVFEGSDFTESDAVELNTIVKTTDRYNELIAKQDAAVKAGSSQDVYTEWKAIRESQEDLNTVIGKLEALSDVAIQLANVASNNNTGKGSVKGRKEVIAEDLAKQMAEVNAMITSLNVADDEWFNNVKNLGDISKNIEDSELGEAHDLIQEGKRLIREAAKSKSKAELDILTKHDNNAAYLIYVDDTEFYKIYGSLLAELGAGSNAPIPEQENVIRHVVAAAMTDYNTHTGKLGKHIIGVNGTYGSGKTTAVTQIAARIIMTMQNDADNPNKGGIITASDNQVQTSKIAASVDGSRSNTFQAKIDNEIDNLVSEQNNDKTTTPKKLIALLELGKKDPTLLKEITLIIFDEASYIGANTGRDNNDNLDQISTLLDEINETRDVRNKLTFVALGDGNQQGAYNLEDQIASIFDRNYNMPTRMVTNHRASNKEITEFIDKIPSTSNFENPGASLMGNSESSWGQVNGSVVRGGVQILSNNKEDNNYDLYNDQSLVDNITEVLDGLKEGNADITNFISIIERTEDEMPVGSLLHTLVSNPEYAGAFALYNEHNFQGSEHAYVIADIGPELVGNMPSTVTPTEFKNKTAMRSLLSRGIHYVHIRDNTNRGFSSKSVGTIEVESSNKMNNASDEIRVLKNTMYVPNGDKVDIRGRLTHIKDLSYSKSIQDEIEIKQAEVETLLNSILGVEDNLTVADTLEHIISTTRAEVAEHAIKVAQAWAAKEKMSLISEYKGFASADGLFEITPGTDNTYVNVVGQARPLPNLPEVLLNFPVTLYTDTEYAAAQILYGGKESAELKKKKAELEKINKARIKMLESLGLYIKC